MSRPPLPSDVGLRLVILYKTVKATAWLVMAAILLIGLQLGLADTLASEIDRIHLHLTHAWSILLAKKLLEAVSRRHLVVAAVGLSFDGVLTAVEAWGLHHRKKWAPWLVVVATGALIPFEVDWIVRRPRIGRIVFFLINLAIVLYLARRIYREREAHRQETLTDAPLT